MSHDSRDGGRTVTRAVVVVVTAALVALAWPVASAAPASASPSPSAAASASAAPAAARAAAAVAPSVVPSSVQIGNPAVMRPARVTAGQIASWYRARTTVAYRATVPVAELARLFLQEGRAEGVAGDLAFVQGVVETGWYGFSGRVPPSANNFAGIGATDSTQAYNTFRSARIGVRAQIQHLRAYADPGVTRAKLANPLESPRFDLVQPKGKAPTWGHMGGGNWATDPNYSQKILTLYQDLLAHASVSSFVDVPPRSFYGPAVAWMEASRITDGVGNTGRYQPAASIARSEVAALLWRMMGRPGRAPHHGFPDVPPGSYYDVAVRYLRAAGITDGVGTSGRFVPTGTVTRAQMVTFLWRLAGTPTPTRRHPFPDVGQGTYYDTAVSWAAQHRITDGVGNTGRFQPLDPVTRGQMAALLYRLVLTPRAWNRPLPPTAP